MKKQVFTCIIWGVVLCCQGQFVPQLLNYPGPGYWPEYFSISNPEHFWVGTIREFNLPYSYSAKTTDGGASWIFNSIPVPGEPFCTSICEWDTNTCFFVFTDITEAGGSIWKTTDGGSTWSGLTTTQFAGGFANFYHAFSADTGVAMGDPTDGYFEIQLTNDGGETWTRLPSENIPPPLAGEISFNDAYSAVGNSVWFATSKGRCFRSADRGQNWNVIQVANVAGGMFDVCFSSAQKGSFYSQNVITSDIAVTYDGGINWDTVTISPGYYIIDMSRVGSFDGGFVFTGYQNFIDVFFTPDVFGHLVKIDSSIISNGSVSFLDASTGWLAGGESGTNEIYKYTGVLTSVNTLVRPPGKLSIMPNPTADEALLKLPGNANTKSLTLRITDMSGRMIGQFTTLTTNWIKLDASDYDNGIYLVEAFSGNELVAFEKWVINH